MNMNMNMSNEYEHGNAVMYERKPEPKHQANQFNPLINQKKIKKKQ